MNNIARETFKARFKAIRIQKGLNQIDFASFLGISRPTVGFYETGKRVPDVEILSKIASKCNVSSDYLVGLTDCATPDVETQAVCKKYGLTEEALERLRAAASGEEPTQYTMQLVNNLLSDLDYHDVNSWYGAYQATKAKALKGAVAAWWGAVPSVQDDDTISLPVTEAAEYFAQRIANHLVSVVTNHPDDMSTVQRLSNALDLAAKEENSHAQQTRE